MNRCQRRSETGYSREAPLQQDASGEPIQPSRQSATGSPLSPQGEAAAPVFGLKGMRSGKVSILAIIIMNLNLARLVSQQSWFPKYVCQIPSVNASSNVGAL